MLYILWGQDDYSLNEALEKIKRDLGDPTVLLINTTILDGRQMTLEQLRTVCETVPFMAERRLVIARGLLERFEPSRKSGREKKNASRNNQQNESKLLGKSLDDYVAKIPDSTILALADSDITGKNPLLKILSDKAKVRHFPLLRGDELRGWVQQRVAQEGGSISPQAVNSLAQFVGGNLWIMASEINKLVTFASGRRIEETDVKEVVSYTQQTSVFVMVDAILESRAKMAEEILQQLLQAGAAPPYLLLMLSRQVHLMIRAKELTRQKQTRMYIQNQLGLTSEFTLRKTLEQADRYSLERIKEVYHKLLETDLSIKTGKYEGELALNLLIAELCQ